MKHDDTTPRAQRTERIDLADLSRPTTTEEGYWKLEGRVARTGIQLYAKADGSPRREYRALEEVKRSLPGFALTPLTNGHPVDLVSPDNAGEHAVGAVGEARMVGDHVVAPITVWTRDAIDAIRAGRAKLSVGYSCRVVHEPGEHRGEPYDTRQTDIRINHVALVDAARCGPSCALRVDACACSTPIETNNHEGKASMEDEAKVLEKENARLRAQADQLEGKARRDREIAKLQAENAKLRSRVEALAAHTDGSTAERASARALALAEAGLDLAHVLDERVARRDEARAAFAQNIRESYFKWEAPPWRADEDLTPRQKMRRWDEAIYFKSEHQTRRVRAAEERARAILRGDK